MSKKDHYSKAYGARMHASKPDFDRCAYEVWNSFLSFQCSRKCGHGPDGAFCKQHGKIMERRLFQIKAKKEGAE